MPKGELEQSSSELSRALRAHMQALSKGVQPINTVGDQAALDLFEEWCALCSGRDEMITALLEDRKGAPLQVCADALKLGCYPPPWAVQALVETIQSYVLMAVNLEGEDGAGSRVDPSQIRRLEAFLFDDVPKGKTVIGHLRSLDHVYEEFCLFAKFDAEFGFSDESTLKGCISKFLSETKRDEDPDTFERGLRLWARKSESGRQVYSGLKDLIAENSRG